MNTSFLLGEKKDIAAGIRRFRDKHGLSQSELAAMTNVSLRTLQNLEAQGVQASSVTVLKLSDFMSKFERLRNKVVA